jgi:hypothetical protein
MLFCLRAWKACYHRWKNEFPSLSRHFTEECKAIRPPIEAQQDNDPKHSSKSTTEENTPSGVAQSES